jgi:hypothetical protein
MIIPIWRKAKNGKSRHWIFSKRAGGGGSPVSGPLLKFSRELQAERRRVGCAGNFHRKKEADIEGGILPYHGMSGYSIAVSTRVVTREQLLVPIQG